MDFPFAYFPYPIVPAGKPCPTTKPENTVHGAPESLSIQTHVNDSRRAQWVSRIIEAQASRVVLDTGDAVELKPVTIENHSPAAVRRFLEITAPHTRQGSVIDTYA